MIASAKVCIQKTSKVKFEKNINDLPTNQNGPNNAVSTQSVKSKCNSIFKICTHNLSLP